MSSPAVGALSAHNRIHYSAIWQLKGSLQNELKIYYTWSSMSTSTGLRYVFLAPTESSLWLGQEGLQREPRLVRLVGHTWSNLPMKVCWQLGQWQGAISASWYHLVVSNGPVSIFLQPQQMFRWPSILDPWQRCLGIGHWCYDHVTLLREQIRTQFGKSSNRVFWQLHPQEHFIPF